MNQNKTNPEREQGRGEKIKYKETKGIGIEVEGKEGEEKWMGNTFRRGGGHE